MIVLALNEFNHDKIWIQTSFYKHVRDVCLCDGDAVAKQTCAHWVVVDMITI